MSASPTAAATPGDRSRGSRDADAAARGSLAVAWLGRVAYAEALAHQQSAVAERIAGRGRDTLWLLEHPAVVTLGRSGDEAHLLESREALAARGVEVHHVARGGDVTLHAPGQLVGYLVMDLAARGAPDLHAFVRRMEEALIRTLAGLGIAGRRIDGRTGVYVDRGSAPTGAAPDPDRKIASIGIGVRRWVTYHGFALNVSIDLEQFDAIVPCGLADVRMTSVARELGVGPLGLDARVRAAVGRAFADVYAPEAAPLPSPRCPGV